MAVVRGTFQVCLAKRASGFQQWLLACSVLGCTEKILDGKSYGMAEIHLACSINTVIRYIKELISTSPQRAVSASSNISGLWHTAVRSSISQHKKPTKKNKKTTSTSESLETNSGNLYIWKFPYGVVSAAYSKPGYVAGRTLQTEGGGSFEVQTCSGDK